MNRCPFQKRERGVHYACVLDHRHTSNHITGVVQSLSGGPLVHAVDHTAGPGISDDDVERIAQAVSESAVELDTGEHERIAEAVAKRLSTVSNQPHVDMLYRQRNNAIAEADKLATERDQLKGERDALRMVASELTGLAWTREVPRDVGDYAMTRRGCVYLASLGDDGFIDVDGIGQWRVRGDEWWCRLPPLPEAK